MEKREPIKLGFGKGFLLVGRQAADKAHYRKWLLVASGSDLTALVTVQVPEQDSAYSDSVVRAALATLAVRPKCRRRRSSACCRSRSATLPASMWTACLRGRALMLSDAPAGSPNGSFCRQVRRREPRAFADRRRARRPERERGSRANFARLAFNEIGGIREIQVTMSEPLRIGGQSGYQTMAEAQRCAHRRRRHGGAVAALRRRRISADGRASPAPTAGPACSRGCARFATASNEMNVRRRRRRGSPASGTSLSEFFAGCRALSLTGATGATLGPPFDTPDHRRPQHALADHVAGLHHLDDAAGRAPTDSGTSNMA